MSEQSRKIVGSGVRASKIVRAPLAIDEILQLDAALVQAFRTIQTLRSQFSAAKYIKFPPLPSIFSESIVIASAHLLFGPGWRGKYGGTACDVLVEHSQGDVKRVEVKATGEHAFQEFKAKDLRADVLIWIRFGRRFQDGNGRIEIALLSEPSRFMSEPCRLDTARFERRIGATEKLRVLSFESLRELLGISSAEP